MRREAYLLSSLSSGASLWLFPASPCSQADVLRYTATLAVNEALQEIRVDVFIGLL
jgi:hypothetical protein